MNRCVRDVMTSPVVTVAPAAPFHEVARRLRVRAISAVPVTDESGRVLGVVSEADLLLKEDRSAVEGGRRFMEGRSRRRARAKAGAGTAAELMTSPAVTVAATAPLAQAARLMRERGVKRLPVVDDDGRMVGIVSRGDLLSVFARGDEEIRDEIRGEVIARTLLLDPGQFEVTVENGVVRLRGEADHRTDAILVERLATRVDGVVNVRSELSYRVDDGDLLPPPNERAVHPLRV